MFENTKCECGHQNYVGTVLCESCGKPLYEDDSTEPLEMRYDGVARRSQQVNPGLVNRVWNFFSSVKIAVYLIFITLCGAMLGTIYPQESTFINIDPAEYYPDTYGTFGWIYYKLGLSHTYESWWFVTLLLMIGTSLVVCSLDRVLPLYRALSKQQIRKHADFISRQKVVYTGTIAQSMREQSTDTAGWVAQAAVHLRKRGFRVNTDGTALLAEKNRFSRWGPYINHIGLIVFLLAVLMRFIPGWYMDDYISILEGETKQIPNTNYYLKNEKFTVEFYTEEEMTDEFKKKPRTVPKRFETQAVLYTCTADCDNPAKTPVLKEVDRHNILVNEPLNYKGLKAYQYDYSSTPQILSVSPNVKNKLTGEQFGPIKLSMNDPMLSYDAGPYKLVIKDYFPDFEMSNKGTPSTKSRTPNTPAFIFRITGPGLASDGEMYMYFPKQIDKERFRQDEINKDISKKLEISVNSMDDVEIANYTTYLNIRIDRAVPYIFVGAVISLIGLTMGFYWQHRRVWLRIDGDELLLGAHTNKNWFGMRNEVATVLRKMGIQVEPKSLDNGVKKQ